MKNTVLIYITCAIAVFFLGQYVHEAWPRYEIKEQIVTHEWCVGYSESIDCRSYIYDEDGWITENLDITYSDIKYYWCDEYLPYQDQSCYIKQKIRIN